MFILISCAQFNVKSVKELNWVLQLSLNRGNILSIFILLVSKVKLNEILIKFSNDIYYIPFSIPFNCILFILQFGLSLISKLLCLYSKLLNSISVILGNFLMKLFNIEFNLLNLIFLTYVFSPSIFAISSSFKLMFNSINFKSLIFINF